MLSDVAKGKCRAVQAPYIFLNNQGEAYEMISQAKVIKIHTDVDLDGFMSFLLIKKWLEQIKKKPSEVYLNDGKVHGALDIDFSLLGDADLLIILDSSTNDLEEIISSIKWVGSECKVLILDHHEIKENSVLRVDENGEPVGLVVNNMTSGDSRFSCGSLVYEFIRAHSMNSELIAKNMKLYQLACVSLFTDSIQMDNQRNLWYAENTLYGNQLESTLSNIVESLNIYGRRLDKSSILFKIAPVFNKAIRANYGRFALMSLLASTDDLLKLKFCEELQNKYVELALNTYEFNGQNCIYYNLTDLGIPDTYCGVIASKLSSAYERSAICAVYTDREQHLVKGSFRGFANNYEYYKLACEQELAEVAGHDKAFGVQGKESSVHLMLSNIVDNEPEIIHRVAYYLMGATGKYDGIHVKSEEEWNWHKRNGALTELARANSVVSVSEQEYIRIPMRFVSFVGVNEKGTMWTYETLGMEIASFEELEFMGEINIYPEEVRNGIKFYVR